MATSYYASTTGSNSNNGLSTGAPFLTIGYGLGVMSGGDTLYLRGGTYNEVLWFNIPSGTSWSNFTLLAAYQAEPAIIRPASDGVGTKVVYFAGFGGGGNSGQQKYIELRDLTLDARAITSDVVKIESNTGNGYNAHHIRLRRCDLIGGQNLHDGGLNGNHCIMLVAQHASDIGFNEFLDCKMHGSGASDTFGYGLYCQASDNLVDGCEVYDTNGAGIQIYNQYQGDLQASRNTIRNNRIHDIIRSSDTRIDGIIVGRGVDNLIYNNEIWNISGFSDIRGIYLYKGVHTKVYHTLTYAIAGTGFSADQGSDHATWTNNVSYNCTRLALDNGTGTTLTSNAFSGVDPQFTDAVHHDFSLQATSPLRNAGVTVAAVTTDIDGFSRPQDVAYCIGPHEFHSTIPDPPPGGNPIWFPSSLDGLGHRVTL